MSPDPTSSFGSKVAVVTGAASGIGRALAIGLARRGANLSLCDIDEAGLRTTAVRAEALGALVHTATVDVSDRAAVQELARESIGRHGTIHQLYNNAGIAGGGRSALDTAYEDFERVLGINLWGVINGTKEFLPHLIASGDGHLVNISSLNGYLAQPGLAAYCTSKFAVRGFTETVRGEMLRDGHPVKVTVVHPGGVKTNIANAALAEGKRRGIATDEDEARTRYYNDTLLRTSAVEAADIILAGVAAGAPRVRVGPDARVVDRLVRVMPERYPAVLTWVERRFGRDERQRPPATGALILPPAARPRKSTHIR